MPAELTDALVFAPAGVLLPLTAPQDPEPTRADTVERCDLLACRLMDALNVLDPEGADHALHFARDAWHAWHLQRVDAETYALLASEWRCQLGHTLDQVIPLVAFPLAGMQELVELVALHHQERHWRLEHAGQQRLPL